MAINGICANCGKPFKGSKRKKFCGQVCGNAAWVRKYRPGIKQMKKILGEK